jgi:hypothetical protein
MRISLIAAAILASASVPALALQANAVGGAWRLPMGGTCDAPMFRSGELGMTSNGETAIRVTLNHAGTTIDALLVLEGARRGQVVHPMTNQALFLVDTPQGRVRVMPMALTYRGTWPEEAHLELCPGTRPAP